MKHLVLSLSFLASYTLAAQNVGLGVVSPSEKFEINGNIRMERLIINGGAVQDNLVKINPEGEIGFKKGHRGFGLRYIICVQGVFPSSNRPEAPNGEINVMGQIKILAGNVVPRGWMLCNGQTLPVNTNQALFSLLGYTYGGSGSSFALPNLQGLAAVGTGSNEGGYVWTHAQRTD